MNIGNVIDVMSAVVLGVFTIALVFLVVLLYRANRVLNKLDHLSDTFKSFVADIVPAIVNMGTIATAVQSALKLVESRYPHSDKDK